MMIARIGPLLVRMAGGDDGSGAGDGPSVLLCHGFGAPGDDLVSLWRTVRAPRGTRWFFPEAPLEVDTGFPGMPGRAWWHIDMARLQRALLLGELRDLENETPDGLARASDLLRATVEALLAHHRVAAERLVIGGFSQGAMLTTELALMHDARFAGLVVLSGTLLSRDRWTEGAKARAAGQHVFQSHGTHDPILPFANAEKLHDLLTAHHATVTFVPFRGQHEIPPSVVDALGIFLRERFL